VKIVGIAGESGTGKSTLAAHVADCYHGVHVDTDAVGHDLLAGDPGVIQAVRERIGEDVFDATGHIDRRRLGEKVFASPDLLGELNAVVHPAIRRRCGELVAAARTSGALVVVVDGALLLDSRMPFRFDLLVALRCDPDTRFERIMAKGGWSEEEVRRRLAAQRSIEKSFYKADAVIDTDGEIEDAEHEIDRLMEDVLGR
jgi:dephospho-CoA kinase